ncbi:rod shape-determining protein MreD [Streptococcus saliviloxodontae]|uniref:rod shape-determining protein MreD n=1 Tax=Streptococcus saliviloxodontae TaxID=1349416 RepID=UPI0019601818
MKYIKEYSIVLLCSIFLLFLDAQFGQFLSNLFNRDFIFISHFLLYYLLILFRKDNKLTIDISVFIVVYCIADLYYFNFIGIYLLSLLSLLTFLHLIKKVLLQNFYYFGLTFFLGCFFFDFIGYLLASVFGLSNLSLFTFVTYSLAPSLLLNAILLLCLHVLPKSFKK